MLVVDDSPVVRDFLVHLLESDPAISVVGTADNGEEACQAVARLRPDVITMDLHMPRLDGVEATRRIMETQPTPIVIVCGSTEVEEGPTAFRAIEAGALLALQRPVSLAHPDHERTARELIGNVKLMAEVRVVRRWSRARVVRPVLPAEPPPFEQKHSLVALGASTGGPPVLQGLLAALPAAFPLPILVVQHMASGFVQSFASWLDGSTPLEVRVAQQGEHIRRGRVYIAPEDRQMRVTPARTIALSNEGPRNGVQPSVACLFHSVAETCGANAVAGLLTGMGRDGAKELRLLRDQGAITFTQDRESSAVFGMPAEAIRLDAAVHVLSPERMVSLLINVAAVNQGDRDDD